MSSSFRRPSTLGVVTAIGKVTFREILADKILYITLVLSVLLMGLALLASQLTIIAPHRVVLDFGMAAVSIASSLVAVFLGATVVQREFDRRTVYVALSHPVSRHQFILGKYFGILLILALNWLMMSGAYLLIYYFAARESFPDWRLIIHPTLGVALLLVLVQSQLLAALAILFSTFSTTSLSAMIVIGLYLVGNNISQIKLVALKLKSELGQAALKAVAYGLPNFENFNLGTKVTYAIPVSSQVLWLGLAYGAGLTAVCLMAAGLLVRYKEV